MTVTYTKSSATTGDSGSYTCQISSSTAASVTTPFNWATVTVINVHRIFYSGGPSSFFLWEFMKAAITISASHSRQQSQPLHFWLCPESETPEQIVDVFVKVHAGHYPKHRIADPQTLKAHNARCFAEMAAAAANGQALF